MANIDLSKLSVIPYLDIPNLNGRFISTLTFHDAGAWRMWIPAGDQLVEIKGWPAESFYFAAEPESATDICFHFLDFIAQRASFSELQKPILGLRDDVFNLSASLAKILHLQTTKDIVGQGVSRMVVTEIEYLFSVCRSVFDLLQEIASTLWESINLLDSSVKKKPLKETFSKMVLFQGKASTEKELIARFGLPQPLAAYYVRNSEFFITLREFRDNVIHRGSQVQTIFSSETGFLIQHSLKPFSGMEIWREEEKQPNNLVPLIPAVCAIIHKTLSACEDFSSTIEQIIEFPSQIAPNMRFYMRGYFNETLSAALRDANSRLTNHLTESAQEAAHAR